MLKEIERLVWRSKTSVLVAYTLAACLLIAAVASTGQKALLLPGAPAAAAGVFWLLSNLFSAPLLGALHFNIFDHSIFKSVSRFWRRLPEYSQAWIYVGVFSPLFTDIALFNSPAWLRWPTLIPDVLAGFVGGFAYGLLIVNHFPLTVVTASVGTFFGVHADAPLDAKWFTEFFKSLTANAQTVADALIAALATFGATGAARPRIELILFVGLITFLMLFAGKCLGKIGEQRAARSALSKLEAACGTTTATDTTIAADAKENVKHDITSIRTYVD